MITSENIIDWSKIHPIGKGRQTTLEDENLIVSIVGGAQGLYGDFEEDFEVAVIDKNSKEFRTKFFFPENSDDVFPYMSGNNLVEFVNKIFKNGFQVK